MTTRVPALLKKTLISVWVANRMTEVDNMDNPDDEDGASNNFLPVHLVDLLCEMCQVVFGKCTAILARLASGHLNI